MQRKDSSAHFRCPAIQISLHRRPQPSPPLCGDRVFSFDRAYSLPNFPTKLFSVIIWKKSAHICQTTLQLVHLQLAGGNPLFGTQGGSNTGRLPWNKAARHHPDGGLHTFIGANTTTADKYIIECLRNQRAIRDSVGFTVGIGAGDKRILEFVIRLLGCG